MQNKLSKVTLYKNEQKISLSVAPFGIHPTKYETVSYERGQSFSNTLRILCAEILEGKFLPTDGCNIFTTKNMKPVLALIEETFLKKPWVHSVVDSSYPKDLNNLTDSFHKRFYQIMGDYLCIFAFPKQFPFSEEEMLSFTKTKIEELSKESFDLFIKKDLKVLRSENLENRIQTLNHSCHTDNIQNLVLDYLSFRIGQETEPALKQYFIRKMDFYSEITVDNINDLERFVQNYPLDLFAYSKLQDEQDKNVYIENR